MNNTQTHNFDDFVFENHLFRVCGFVQEIT